MNTRANGLHVPGHVAASVKALLLDNPQHLSRPTRLFGISCSGRKNLDMTELDVFYTVFCIFRYFAGPFLRIQARPYFLTPLKPPLIP